jgi:RNA polymerase II C-terminal domain phosphatase-like 3/4
VVTRGGRQGGRAKPNQDAFLLRPVACPGGEAPALLLGVFDGHGTGGSAAAQAAAGGLAGALPAMRAQLLADAGPCGGAQGCSPRPALASQGRPLAQQALVKAFQAVAASMRYDTDFLGCGAAGVACLVEPGSITAAWAGDCRAVVGLSVEGPARPTVMVHALTRDHKPSR